MDHLRPPVDVLVAEREAFAASQARIQADVCEKSKWLIQTALDRLDCLVGWDPARPRGQTLGHSDVVARIIARQPLCDGIVIDLRHHIAVQLHGTLGVPLTEKTLYFFTVLLAGCSSIRAVQKFFILGA